MFSAYREFHRQLPRCHQWWHHPDLWWWNFAFRLHVATAPTGWFVENGYLIFPHKADEWTYMTVQAAFFESWLIWQHISYNDKLRIPSFWENGLKLPSRIRQFLRLFSSLFQSLPVRCLLPPLSLSLLKLNSHEKTHWVLDASQSTLNSYSKWWNFNWWSMSLRFVFQHLTWHFWPGMEEEAIIKTRLGWSLIAGFCQFKSDAQVWRLPKASQVYKLSRAEQEL